MTLRWSEFWYSSQPVVDILYVGESSSFREAKGKSDLGFLLVHDPSLSRVRFRI